MRALGGWRRAGLVAGTALNVSDSELSDGSIVDQVAQPLKATTYPAELLSLEVTEARSWRTCSSKPGVGRTRRPGHPDSDR